MFSLSIVFSFFVGSVCVFFPNLVVPCSLCHTAIHPLLNKNNIKCFVMQIGKLQTQIAHTVYIRDLSLITGWGSAAESGGELNVKI